MTFFIVPILFGNNMDTLFGIKNDIYIIYNLFYTFYSKYPNTWNEPAYFYNENCIFDNIKPFLNINKNKKKIFLIYFSGHSNSKGFLKFHNENINSIMILDYINKNINNFCRIYFVIDTCYSKSFILNLNNNYINNYYTFIEKIYFMGSCMDNERSKEIEVKYDKSLFETLKIEPCSKLVVGIFSLYFVKLLLIRRIDDISLFKNIIEDKLWKMISLQFNQTIYYIEI
jgi:hypothetical protein